MRSRCKNPKAKAWPDYGARGITVCDRWNDFATFVADMGPRPAGYSLERKNNDEGYSPDNCCWADRTTQQRNRRLTVYVIVDGERYKAIELAERIGVKTDTIVDRAARGLSLDNVLSPLKLVNKVGLALGGPASGAKKHQRSHCKWGHEMTFENTYITSQGWRNCRACQNAKMRRYTAAKRAPPILPP